MTQLNDIMMKLAAWERTQRMAVPMSDEEALVALAKGRVSEHDLSSKLDRLTLNGARASPRVLVSYADLQALDRLDGARQGVVLDDNPQAATVRAIFQAAEIALINISDLAKRVADDIDEGDFGEAEEKYRWVSSFQQTLHAYALLVAKLPSGQPGCLIGLQQSPHAKACLTDLNILHEKLWSAGLISAEQIGGRDIHDPRRNLTHHAFTDVTYTTLWNNGLRAVNLPGVTVGSAETEDAFYKRLVGTDSLYLAVHELDQLGDNFLRQFRAFHQMSEILARQANQLIARSIKTVLGTDDDLFVACDHMSMALELIGQINNNVVPILRNLSVKRYQDIRGSLGITSGSHSPNIKRGLFTTLYPLFVEAVTLCVMGLENCDDRLLHETLRQIVNHPTQNRETYDKYDLLRKANQLHASLRTWRELHMQFIRTHLGISMVTPTASISGAINGGLTATRMMTHAHGRETDPIVPIYEALLQKPFESSGSFAESQSDSFPIRMEIATIAVVVELSADVQERAVAMRQRSA